MLFKSKNIGYPPHITGALLDSCEKLVYVPNADKIPFLDIVDKMPMYSGVITPVAETSLVKQALIADTNTNALGRGDYKYSIYPLPWDYEQHPKVKEIEKVC